jgi:hypothetical protein
MATKVERAACACVLMVLQAGLARAVEPGTTRTHPELASRLASIKTVGLVAPDLEVFELTAANASVLRPDWTEQGREAVLAALEEVLQQRGLKARRLTALPPGQPEAAELQEVQALCEVVAGAVLQATFVNRFPAKVQRFEYGLGELDRLLSALEVDALIFTIGTGAVSSGGRAALQAVSAVLAGVHSSGVDRLVVGLVDRQGDLLWFSIHSSTKSDLRNQAGAAEFTRALAEDLLAVQGRR